MSKLQESLEAKIFLRCLLKMVMKLRDRKGVMFLYQKKKSISLLFFL